jgi:octaprenyl-diphosphate synthase
MDDLLDLLGEEALVGKTLGSDVSKGKPTLPLIHHLAHTDAAGREQALERARANDRPGLLALLKTTGSFKYTADKATGYVASAKQGLEVLEPGPMRDLLHDVADFVLSREL